jgi:hypothetical protein
MKRPAKVTLQRAVKLLRATNGTVFRATFVKRTDGTVRNLVGRLDVTKGITGAGMKYDPFDRGLMTVYDFQKKGFRMVNLESLTEICVKGHTYAVK